MNNTGKIILSILIPTIPSRANEFNKLYNCLIKQTIEVSTIHPTLGEIEIICDESKAFLKGGPSIGKKCEALVRRATGKYLCILHDDDLVSPNFVESILRLCQSDRDIITFRNITKLDNFWMLVDMRLGYNNDQANPNFTVRRKPWIICPVKSEFAKQFLFPDTNYSEDSDWMEQVLTRCTTESHTDEILHMYRHSKYTSEADKITNHVQPKP